MERVVETPRGSEPSTVRLLVPVQAFCLSHVMRKVFKILQSEVLASDLRDHCEELRLKTRFDGTTKEAPHGVVIPSTEALNHGLLHVHLMASAWIVLISA